MYNNSSSRQPVIRMAARAVSPWDVVLAAAAWGTVLALWAAAQPFALPPEAPPAAEPPEQAQFEAERDAVWNSPPMMAARGWLDEYFRTSKTASPEAEQAYLRRLSQLPAEEMREWMRRFYRKRSNLIAQHNRETQVRRMGLAQASQQRAANYVSARRPLPGYPANTQPPSPPVNYVQSRPAPYAMNEPIRSYRYLFYLDTLDIRDSLRELRAAR
ncbi:MAG: hypothetical protein KDA37_02010 [Planctomycetales bacterium]|nr:hypothetical protein [Planctomycetales bacterium]